MKKILFLNPDRGHTCSFYRSGGVVKDLRHQLSSDYTVDVVSWQDIPVDWQSILNYDIVMLQRPYQSTMLDFCKHVKQMNIKLWVDYDDNMFTVSPENRAWPIFSDPNIQKNIKAFLTLADVITVTNKDLQDFYLQFNKNVIIVPNAFNDSIFPVERVLPARTDNVVWRGSDTHIYDIMLYTSAINQVTSEFPQFEFTYVGYNPWFLEQGKNVTFHKALDIIDYFTTIYTLAPKVVQVPLFDSNFNRCKSNIAFIEATYWGAVAIIPEFWGEIPGTLSYKDNATYYEALRSVLAGEVDVKDMNDKAWVYIKENLLLSKVNKVRIDIINNLLK
jgi:hypothetical protein